MMTATFSNYLQSAFVLFLVNTPSLISAHQHHHNHHHHHHDTKPLPDILVKLSTYITQTSSPQTILYICTFLLTVFPLLLMLVIPKNLPNPVERILVSFSLGTMLSEIFLHLLPDVFAHDHGSASQSTRLLSGFLISYLIERVLGLVMGLSPSTHDHHNHDHDHHHDHTHHNDILTEGQSTSTESKGSRIKQLKKRIKKTPSSELTHEVNHDNKHEVSIASPNKIGISSNAVIHVLAMSIHVATDGLLLALAFSGGSAMTGLSTFFGVFFHEIPHRLGDFSLLQGALGLSRGQAILAQVWLSVVSALGVFAGSSLIPKSGLNVAMPIVSGMLLYVATVGVIPELSGGHHHHHGDHAPSTGTSSSSWFKIILLGFELAAIYTGVQFAQH